MHWMEQIHQQFVDAMSHMFVVSGNINDLTEHCGSVEGLLITAFASGPPGKEAETPQRTCVLYDLAGGIDFPTTADRTRFERILREADLDRRSGESGARTGTGGGGGGLADMARSLGGGNLKDLPPTLALKQIDRALRAGPPGDATEEEAAGYRLCVIIRQGEYVFPAGDLSSLGLDDRLRVNLAETWSKDRSLGDSYHILFVLTNSPHDVHPRLLSSTSASSAIDVPMPDTDERERYVAAILGEKDTPLGRVSTEMSPREIATRTSGLGRRHVEDIFFRALNSDGHKLTPELIHARKKQILFSEYGDVLQVEDPVHGYELVPGHDLVKAWFRRTVIPGLASGDRRTPSGVLLVGPPGTGKTWFAQATAKEAGVNFLQLSLGSLLDMYVGNSEAALEKALRAIWQLGGICLIDELDQQLTSRSSGMEGGSSVDARFLGRLLAFMADPRLKGRVVFLAATNRPDKIDAAIKRSGRFDRKVPFLPPEEHERAGVLAAQLRFQDIDVEGELHEALVLAADGRLSEVDDAGRAQAIERLIEATDGWVHSDFQNLTAKAWELASASATPLVSADHLCAASQDLLPTRVDEDMLAASLQEVNDLSLLPPRYRQRARRQEEDAEAARPQAASRRRSRA